MFQQVFYYCGLMILFYAGSSLLSYILSASDDQPQPEKSSTKCGKEVFNHLLDLPVNYFDQHQTGDILSRLSYDIDTVNASLSNDLLQICTSIITVVGSFIMMVRISPPPGIGVHLYDSASILFYAVSFPGKSGPCSGNVRKRLGELNGYAEEIISGHKTIKAYHREETMEGRFNARNTDAVDALLQRRLLWQRHRSLR